MRELVTAGRGEIESIDFQPRPGYHDLIAKYLAGLYLDGGG